MALEFTDTNFKEATSQGISVVDFWAQWCGPCRAVAPIIEDLAKELEGKVHVGKLDIDSNPLTPSQFNVRSIPTILILKDGIEVDRHVGTTTKQALAAKIESQVVA